MMPAAAMSDAEFILARRLANNWSSPELAQLLEQRPSFYAALSPAFPKLDKAVKMRILLAFLALDQISEKDVVMDLLNQADNDSDQWVKAVSALVREWLFNERGDAALLSEELLELPFCEIAHTVLQKSGLLGAGPTAGEGAEAGDDRAMKVEAGAEGAADKDKEVVKKETPEGGDKEAGQEKKEGDGAEAATPMEVDGEAPSANGTANGPALKTEDGATSSAGDVALLPPEPYFSPVEFLYLSSAMVQRIHAAAPLTRADNPHFSTRPELVDLVRLPAVPDADDDGAIPAPMPLMAFTPHEPPSRGAFPPPSSSLDPLPPFRPSAPTKPSTNGTPTEAPAASAPAPSKSSASGSKPGPSKPSSSLFPSSLSSGLASRSTSGGSRAAAVAAARKDKGTLKRIDLSDVAKAQEKRAEVDVEVQQEMNKVVLKAPQLPTPQPPPGAKRQGAEGFLSPDGKRSLGGADESSAASVASMGSTSSLLSGGPPAPASSSAPSFLQSPLPPLPPPNPLTPAPLLAPAFATPASVGAFPAAPPGSGGRGAEYVKYTEKRNRLTPEDDERMRQFFEHGPPANFDPAQPEVRIKVNEEVVRAEDGKHYRETLYVYLNYAEKTTKLSKKKKLVAGEGAPSEM